MLKNKYNDGDFPDFSEENNHNGDSSAPCPQAVRHTFLGKTEWHSVAAVGGHGLQRAKISASSAEPQIKQLVSLLAGDRGDYVLLSFLYNQD